MTTRRFPSLSPPSSLFFLDILTRFEPMIFPPPTSKMDKASQPKNGLPTSMEQHLAPFDLKAIPPFLHGRFWSKRIDGPTAFHLAMDQALFEYQDSGYEGCKKRKYEHYCLHTTKEQCLLSGEALKGVPDDSRSSTYFDLSSSMS